MCGRRARVRGEALDVEVSSEAEYFDQADFLGAGRAQAGRVLHAVTAEAGTEQGTEVYQLAYEQLVADLNRNPK